MDVLKINKTKIVGDKAYIIDFENKYTELVNEIIKINNIELIEESHLGLIHERVYILLIMTDNNIDLTNTIINIASTGSYILVTSEIYTKYFKMNELLIEITNNNDFTNYINIESSYCGMFKHARFSKLINYYNNINNINNPELKIDNIKKLNLIPNYDSCLYLKFRFEKIIPYNVNSANKIVTSTNVTKDNKIIIEKYRNIFFGGYLNIGIDKLLNTKNSIIVWLGSDILKVILSPKYYSIIKNRKDIIHVGISKNICNILNYLNVQYLYCIMPTIFEKSFINNLYNVKYEKDDKVKNTVYCYDVGESLVYNYQIIKYLQKKLPQFKFIIYHNRFIPREKLLYVYKDCFIGLRLTDFDGNARTVLEMGMLGKKVISNTGYPNCIPWKSLKDLEKIIIDEYNSQTLYYPELRKECYRLFELHENIQNKLLNI